MEKHTWVKRLNIVDSNFLQILSILRNSNNFETKIKWEKSLLNFKTSYIATVIIQLSLIYFDFSRVIDMQIKNAEQRTQKYIHASKTNLFFDKSSKATQSVRKFRFGVGNLGKVRNKLIRA